MKTRFCECFFYELKTYLTSNLLALVVSGPVGAVLVVVLAARLHPGLLGGGLGRGGDLGGAAHLRTANQR